MDEQIVECEGITEESIIADLLAAYPAMKPREPGWVDKAEAAKIWRCSPTTAETRLKNLVGSGKWEAEDFMAKNGKTIMCYRKKQE